MLENNNKMDLSQIIRGGMDWNSQDHDKDHWRAIVNTVINFRVP
jgi:hypothetical protein